MNVIDSKELSMLFSEKSFFGLDPGVVHPRIKSEEEKSRTPRLRGDMLFLKALQEREPENGKGQARRRTRWTCAA